MWSQLSKLLPTCGAMELIVRSENGYFVWNCAFCDKSIRFGGDMRFNVLFDIRVGATLGTDVDPPFLGVKAPHFYFFCGVRY